MRQALFSEIRSFTPEGDAEAAHRTAILKLLENPDHASRTNFYPGHITASAFIIDLSSHRLLLHRHRRLGRWLQMGGHLEVGEAPSAAALREGTEESGLTDLRLLFPGIIDLDVHEIPSSSVEPAHQHFDLRYVAATSQPFDIAFDPVESLSLGWFSFDDAVTMMNEPCSARAVGKIRRLLAGTWSLSPTG